MRLSSPFNAKRGLMALALAGIVGALAWALWPKPVPVELAEVRKGPLVVTVDEEGKTRIKDVYAVSAPITGKLVRLALEAGDRVKKDVTIVAVIEPMAPPPACGARLAPARLAPARLALQRLARPGLE